MLDVHPPHGPVHGIRDFLLHLLTITVGLLIALGLEAAVEWRHHVHLRHEAEDNIRHEIRDNQADLLKMLTAIPAEQDTFQGLLTGLDAQAAGSEAKTHISLNTIRLKIGSLQDASWQTAAATGALAYMDYAEVKRFAAAYQLQKKLDVAQDAAMQPTLSLLSGLISAGDNQLNQQQAAAAAVQVREAITHVGSMQAFGNELNRLYGVALKPE